MIRCPACFSANFDTVSPGQFRCRGQVLRDVVPPGYGGNAGAAGIPLYGECGQLFNEVAGLQAGVKAAQAEAAVERDRQAAAKAAAAQAAEQKDLERRKIAVLTALKAAGNPGLKQRQVPGRYYLSFFARLFGQVGQDMPVDVEPAWPTGSFTWVLSGAHGVDDFEELETGFTPSERFVPMGYGTDGDDVEILYRRRRMWSTGNVGYRGRKPSLSDIVPALERCLDASAVKLRQPNPRDRM